MVLVCLKLMSMIGLKPGPGRVEVHVATRDLSTVHSDQHDVTHFGTRPKGFSVSLSDRENYGRGPTLWVWAIQVEKQFTQLTGGKGLCLLD
jgi:hypothetical protein